jgi:hypothetical protein
MTVPAQRRSERSPVEKAFPLRSPHTGNAAGTGRERGTRRGAFLAKIRNVPQVTVDRYLERVRWVMFLVAILTTAYVFLF